MQALLGNEGCERLHHDRESDDSVLDIWDLDMPRTHSLPSFFGSIYAAIRINRKEVCRMTECPNPR